MTQQKVTPEPCAECGRMLRSKKSIDQQRGPACQKKYLKRLKEAGQIDDGSSGKTAQLQARQVEVYLVTDFDLVERITELPRVYCETAEIKVFTDRISWRCGNDKQVYEVPARAQDGRYNRIKTLLREATEGVKRITDQIEVSA